MSRTCFALVLSFFLAAIPLSSHALTLEEGIKIAVEDGRDITIARSDEDAARAAVSLARSPWLPFVDLYARETWLQYQPAEKLPPSFITPGGPTSIPAGQDRFVTYGVRATQLLYDFGKTSSEIDAAKFGLRARESETQQTRNQAALDFIVAYLDLLESEKLLQVANEEVTNYEAHKKDTEARYAAGVVTRNEVLQADVTLSDSRQRRLSAENLRSFRESRIDSLLLKPLNEPVQPVEVKASPAQGLTLEGGLDQRRSNVAEDQGNGRSNRVQGAEHKRYTG